MFNKHKNKDFVVLYSSCYIIMRRPYAANHCKISQGWVQMQLWQIASEYLVTQGKILICWTRNMVSGKCILFSNSVTRTYKKTKPIFTTWWGKGGWRTEEGEKRVFLSKLSFLTGAPRDLTNLRSVVSLWKPWLWWL